MDMYGHDERYKIQKSMEQMIILKNNEIKGNICKHHAVSCCVHSWVLY